MDRNNESFIGGKVLISLVTGVVLLIFVFVSFSFLLNLSKTFVSDISQEIFKESP